MNDRRQSDKATRRAFEAQQACLDAYAASKKRAEQDAHVLTLRFVEREWL